jgi:hypothetical protein
MTEFDPMQPRALLQSGRSRHTLNLPRIAFRGIEDFGRDVALGELGS